MNNISLFQKIKSKYICRHIFGFIKEENYYIKLIGYSKRFQHFLGLSLLSYQEKYFEQLDLNIDNYLYSNIYKENFLKNKLEELIQKYALNINAIQNGVVNYYKKYIKEKKINEKNEITDFFSHEVNIDVFSPFIELLQKYEEIKEIFTVQIDIPLLKEHNLSEKYIDFFKKSEYVSYGFLFDDIQEVEKIKEFNIILFHAVFYQHFFPRARLIVIRLP